MRGWIRLQGPAKAHLSAMKFWPSNWGMRQWESFMVGKSHENYMGHIIWYIYIYVYLGKL